MKPTLELTVSLRGPGGQRHRLAPDARAAGDRPLDLSFNTEAGEGFTTGQITLRRQYDQEFPDLALLNEAVLEGHSGDIAYEGRIQGVPRSLGAGGPEVRLDCHGWMSAARSRPFVDLLIDRSFGSWGPPSLGRRAAIMTAGLIPDKSYTGDAGEAGLTLTGDEGSAIAVNQTAELWYRSPVEIGMLGYRGTLKNTTSTVGSNQIDVAYSGVNLSGLPSTITLDGTVRALPVAPAWSHRWLVWRVKASAAHTPAAGSGFQGMIDLVAVYGDTGIPLVDNPADGMGAIMVSDAISYLVGKYAPAIDATGISQNQFLVPHAVWREPVTVQDAIKELNVYSQWALGVYENRRLEYRPFDLSTYDWEVRAGQDGVEIETQGVTVEDAFNGVVVQYQDWAGVDQVVTPDQSVDLQDTNPAIAANQWGERAWTTLQLSNPQTTDGAVQIGRMFLADLNRPKFPSTITVPGHIRDRSGAWQPAWKVRANQTISVRNHPNDHPRLITGTSWSGNQLQITTDNALNRFEAIIGRLDRGRNPGGN